MLGRIEEILRRRSLAGVLGERGAVHLLPPQVSNSSIYLGDAAPKRVRNETDAKTIEHEGVASQIDESPPARYTSATRMIIVAGHPLLSAPGSTTPTPAPGPAGRSNICSNSPSRCISCISGPG